MQKIESQPCRWWVEIAPGSQPYLALEANNPAPKGYGGTGEVQAAQVFPLADDGTCLTFSATPCHHLQLLQLRERNQNDSFHISSFTFMR